jgi:putative Mn2+ efflux pump MntP
VKPIEPHKDPRVSAYRKRWGGIILIGLGVLSLVRHLVAGITLDDYGIGTLIGGVLLIALGVYFVWSSRRT